MSDCPCKSSTAPCFACREKRRKEREAVFPVIQFQNDCKTVEIGGVFYVLRGSERDAALEEAAFIVLGVAAYHSASCGGGCDDYARRSGLTRCLVVAAAVDSVERIRALKSRQ